MIGFHTAVDQDQAIRANRVDSSQYCTYIPRILGGNNGHREFKSGEFLQAALFLADQCGDPLGIFLFCKGFKGCF